MGFNIQFSIEGDKQISRTLLVMADRVKDWTPAFSESAAYMKGIFQNEVFPTQGGVIEEHWAPLSRAYAARKAKRYPGRGILQATGEMRNGFLTLWRPDMAQIWNKMEYFKYHQSNQPRHKLPRRVMIKLANAQRTQIVKIFHNYYHQMIQP